MKDRDPSPRQLLKSLERGQHKHKTLLARVEKTTARLAHYRLKLLSLESRIAGLERSVAEPGKRHAGEGNSDRTLRLERIVKSLREHGIHVDIGFRTCGKEARAHARRAVRRGTPLVVVAAGDGTIGGVASQLIGSTTVLGIVPIGTMNNVARSLGVPLEIEDACALIGTGTTRHIDIGSVTSNAVPDPEYFLECAGIGLSAITAAGGQSFEKHRWHLVPRALRKFFEAKLGRVRVELDGETIEASTRVVTVSNAPLMGGNMLAAPDAKMDDGFLDVHVYDGMGDVALLRHFEAAASAKPDDLRSYRARHIRIAADEGVASNSDMEIMGSQHEIEIKILPGAVSIIVGNGIALSLPVESAPDAPTFATAPPPTNGTPHEPEDESALSKG